MSSTTVGIEYSVVSGYVAVLFGRSRATEYIDVITERFDEGTADELAKRLREAGYWGSAMPLDDLHKTLADDLPARIAEEGHRVPKSSSNSLPTSPTASRSTTLSPSVSAGKPSVSARWSSRSPTSSTWAPGRITRTHSTSTKS